MGHIVTLAERYPEIWGLIFSVLELDLLQQGEAKLGVIAANKGREHCHLMDTKAPGKEVTQQLARESLIAISQSLPDNSKLSSKNLSSVDVVEVIDSDGAEKYRPKLVDVVEVIDSDGAEKYRSKLISISYSESPDIKTLPVTLGNLNG
ncbi:hypothetical protein HHK36_000790 [Tetracentron sinense]|uniref:Uncharacterized protein n=1 Tax=Tetracentron sinense TaxID=13715 RepID=A0A835DU64_TETSI|nr:hypothetical protein HHK36_000790 [Tetracentron sinense]